MDKKTLKKLKDIKANREYCRYFYDDMEHLQKMPRHIEFLLSLIEKKEKEIETIEEYVKVTVEAGLNGTLPPEVALLSLRKPATLTEGDMFWAKNLPIIKGKRK